MKNRMKSGNQFSGRKGEKGAAMVMVILISFLLLVASAGLILEVSLNTSNITDATAEQQAYNAAESGIQSALNVLRGNTTPSPLINSAKPANDPENRIDFKKAITLSKSNKPADTSTTARLSRWVSYNYTPTGSSNPARVTLGGGSYNPNNGYAYSLEVIDPDNTGQSISFSTSANINGGGNSIVVGSGGNTATISYISTSKTNLDVSSGSASTDVGQFVISSTGVGAVVPPEGYRFAIRVDLHKPFTATRVIRGTIESGAINSTSTGSVKINFDSGYYSLMGSTITMASDPLTPNSMAGGVSQTTISVNVTPTEPIRLLVKSTGYGPRGAKKELEAVVRKNFFDGMSAPATLTLIGSTTGFVFKSGNSQNVLYSGDDVVSDFQLPPIGTSAQANLDAVKADLAATGVKTDVIGHPANVTWEMPPWLESAEKLDDVLQSLKNVAKSSGSYYPSGTAPVSVGNNANATGLTYVDGNLELSGAGGGILVVTGTLTLKGEFDFNGLVIVTGSGGLNRSGGGNGVLQGNIVIAPYNPNDLPAGFLGPKYDISGGGTSDIVYNSSSVANGLTAVSNFVLGVADK